MMMQYIEQKEALPDCLLFFRLGDFYEMFFDDAVTVSRELELALTGRDCGLDERAPMCGVPYHAADTYIGRLVSRGYKVAVCEQVEDPALAKGLVRREIIRVVTPGTITDLSALEEKRNNYIVSIYRIGAYFGLAAADLTTGGLEGTTLATGDPQVRLLDEIARFQPSEILCNPAMADHPVWPQLTTRAGTPPTCRPDSQYSHETAARLFPGTDAHNAPWGPAAAALMLYLEETQRRMPDHMRNMRVYSSDEYMAVDPVARRNLEMVETMRDKSRRGSLLWVLDRTRTPMGGRMLRRWVEQPLMGVGDINRRLDAVGELKDRFLLRQEIREALQGIGDIERLTGKASLGSIHARDLLALRAALGHVPYVAERTAVCAAPLLTAMHAQMDPMEDIRTLLENAVADDAPMLLRDGGIIRTGYNEEVDRLRTASTDGRDWILELEAREREKSGIRTLKVGYNRVFGYYIEVTKANIPLVPKDYIRKQTLANGERYITEELKTLEDAVLGAQKRLSDLEYELFVEIRGQVAAQAGRLLALSDALAQLDAVASLAEVADRESYCRPDVNMSTEISIQAGRHPVVEKILGPGKFVPNDTSIDMDLNRFLLLTGPNMAGKSTYMRQVALIVLMAQSGSFVPARSAGIGIVDRIFTRVGASDDLSAGDSTFMVEMREVAGILHSATERSLLILDEIGRGTSTYDGLSIAFAVIEHIADREQLGARTLFATHYHELTDLEGVVPGIVNYHVAVDEEGGEVRFLHRIDPGGSDDSYGIEVARLAGVPDIVVQRAKEILRTLESENQGRQRLRIRKSARPMDGQVDLFTASAAVLRMDGILEKLRTTDVQSMTPLDAMNLLYDLVQKARKSGREE
ncbi:MAG: DNA mismatch repair protein MutS [Clostridia bacterium]|nr:DNA mismatch repair protein MutS [Clostridia bacterium]